MVGFIIADILEMDENTETAKLRTENGDEITVRTWEIAGYVRVADDYAEWKYLLTENWNGR